MPLIELGPLDAEYPSYQDVEGADAYMVGRIGATAWDGAGNEDKSKALISATRRIIRYLGSRIPADQIPDPSVATAAEVPVPLPDAATELAFVFIGDPTQQDAANSGSNVKSVGAGSANVAFFRSTATTASAFPTTVQDLLNAFLASIDGLTGISPPFASGVATELAVSSFLEEDEFGFREPSC